MIEKELNNNVKALWVVDYWKNGQEIEKVKLKKDLERISCD